MSGSMSGDWKRSYGVARGAPRTERRGHRDATPTATAPVVDSTALAQTRRRSLHRTDVAHTAIAHARRYRRNAKLLVLSAPARNRLRAIGGPRAMRRGMRNVVRRFLAMIDLSHKICRLAKLHGAKQHGNDIN